MRRTRRQGCASAYLVDGVAPVLRERAHLFLPAALLAPHPPIRAHQHIWAANLLDRGIARRLVLLGNCLAADLMPERLALHAGHRAHTRHLLQKGHVLDVIDFVEERFLGWIDIHADDEDITCGERHGLASLDGETACTYVRLFATDCIDRDATS